MKLIEAHIKLLPLEPIEFRRWALPLGIHAREVAAPFTLLHLRGFAAAGPGWAGRWAGTRQSGRQRPGQAVRLGQAGPAAVLAAPWDFSALKPLHPRGLRSSDFQHGFPS